MKIDQELVQKLAHLARLELSAEEEVAFSKQLPAVVEYVGRLQAAQLPIIPTESPNDTPMRSDAVHARSSRDEILDQAPVRQDDFWKVDSVKGQS